MNHGYLYVQSKIKREKNWIFIVHWLKIVSGKLIAGLKKKINGKYVWVSNSKRRHLLQSYFYVHVDIIFWFKKRWKNWNAIYSVLRQKIWRIRTFGAWGLWPIFLQDELLVLWLFFFFFLNEKFALDISTYWKKISRKSQKNSFLFSTNTTMQLHGL